MKNNETIKIKIELNEQTKIYNEFNNNQLSDELSNFIYNQCKGISNISDIELNINHNFKMTEEEQIKLVDSIRANYGIDVKENLIKIKQEHFKELLFLILGILLLIFSNLFSYINASLMDEVISIFGCVTVWEVAYNIIFIETRIREDNKRLKKLTEIKINFNEIKKNTNEL